MKEFSIYQKGIFDLLKNGKPPAISREEFFYNAIAEETGKIAESHGCSVEINNKRLFEAQDLWTWDMMSMSRTGKIDGPPSTVPCEFKHAAPARACRCRPASKSPPAVPVSARQHVPIAPFIRGM